MNIAIQDMKAVNNLPASFIDAPSSDPDAISRRSILSGGNFAGGRGGSGRYGYGRGKGGVRG